MQDKSVELLIHKAGKVLLKVLKYKAFPFLLWHLPYLAMLCKTNSAILFYFLMRVLYQHSRPLLTDKEEEPERKGTMDYPVFPCPVSSYLV